MLILSRPIPFSNFHKSLPQASVKALPSDHSTQLHQAAQFIRDNAPENELAPESGPETP